MRQQAIGKRRGGGVVAVVFVLGFIGHCPAVRGEALVQSVGIIGMTVSNMERSVQFFSKVLEFENISEWEAGGAEYEKLVGVSTAGARVVRMKRGDEAIELTEYRASKGRRVPADSRSNDRWFQHIAIVVADMDRAYEKLRAHNARLTSPAPQRIPNWNKAAAGIRALYFKDNDGHDLELIHFPPGKGDPKWQKRSARLFLGIDHTAIAVSDTDRSLRFYRDLLGMKQAGESENYGMEQERLNRVVGSRVRISGLRAKSGPGVEFLDYLIPRDGRPIPVDSRANDLWHWQTAMGVRNAEVAADKLRGARAPFVSSGVATAPEPAFGFRKSFVAKDPDGHAVQLIER